MHTRLLVVACAVGGACIAASTAASAETIFGTLTGPAGPNARLSLTCERGAARAIADKAGSYRLTAGARGRCHLQVNNMPPPGELVFVYDEPTRYDYEVTVVNGITRIERR